MSTRLQVPLRARRGRVAVSRRPAASRVPRLGQQTDDELHYAALLQLQNYQVQESAWIWSLQVWSQLQIRARREGTTRPSRPNPLHLKASEKSHGKHGVYGSIRPAASSNDQPQDPEEARGRKVVAASRVRQANSLRKHVLLLAIDRNIDKWLAVSVETKMRAAARHAVPHPADKPWHKHHRGS